MRTALTPYVVEQAVVGLEVTSVLTSVGSLVAGLTELAVERLVVQTALRVE